MFALKIDLSNAYTNSRYSKQYPIQKFTDIGYQIAYELFDLYRQNDAVLNELKTLPAFISPGENYLSNVYGLLVVQAQSDFEEIIAEYRLDIENYPHLSGRNNTGIKKVDLWQDRTIESDEVHTKGSWRIKTGHHGVELNKLAGIKTPIMMGILNITPDSFSDGGKHFTVEDAVNAAREMADHGIAILDIGGESTRPGSDRVSLDEELRRVIPAIEAIHTALPEMIISVDTYKSEVAAEAAQAGATIINDISGGVFDERIFAVTREFECAYVLMHTLSDPKNMQKAPAYINPVLEIITFLLRQAAKAKAVGLENIIIDPGIGFGKTVENNFEIISRLNEFTQFGYPVLLGVSRKNFIGKTLNLEVAERDSATSMMELFGLLKGASIIRTHNATLAYQLQKLYKHLNGPHD